jgi:hypothetical protein
MVSKNMREDGAEYCEVVIVGRSPETDIWLGDDEGHLVQRGEGTLETSVLPGLYTVEFGLGTTTFPLRVTGNACWTEEEIAAGPSCPRPIPSMPPLESES